MRGASRPRPAALAERIERLAVALQADGAVEDDRLLDAFVAERDALVELLAPGDGVPAEERAALIGRVLEVDRGILACLAARKAAIAGELRAIGESRRSLHSYGAAPLAGPLYVERLG